MSLDKATVARIAHLARIRLAEEAQEAMATELSGILRFVEQLGELDTSDVPPMTSAVEQGLRWRDDAVNDGNAADKVLANAAESTGGFYVVPKVVE